MPRTARIPTESLTATVRLRGQDFDFRLYTRPLQLGPSGTVRYYWMDSSQFRIARGRREFDPANFRNCVGHWWLAMQSMGLGGNSIQVAHLILATSYALVSRGNALQHVYRDAHLAPDSTRPAEQSLPDPVRGRIRAAVQSREAARVRGVLDELLDRAEVPVAEATAMDQTFDLLLHHGVELVRQKGVAGLAELLGRFDAWCAKRRKKGGQGWLRCFLDLFAYECKVSFYRCYANVWVDLIPWLREHRALDEASERFLRLWHMQNQPMELPDRRVLPDVFGGQVLSLHPLSGFFMKDTGLRAIAGRFFLSQAYEQAIVHGHPEDCAEYWDLVGAILTAAGLYRQALDRQAERRRVRQRNSADPDVAEVADETRSAAGLLEEFAEAVGLCCTECGGALLSQGFDPADAEADDFDADFACRDCGHEARHRIARRDLEASLLGRP
jgi:hypothetical protein